MTPAPKCRWSYSLRTLFVVVTVFGTGLGWLVYQLNWIHQRNAVTDRKGVSLVTGINGWTAEAPWPLSLFGEQGYAWILLYFPDPSRLKIAGSGPSNWEKGEPLLHPDERTELNRARQLFPEARIDVTYLPFR